VANLTLMALGSSAPEILLSCIEIVGRGFVAGDLGPGTIVGSAAFNLFCITGVCIFAVPTPEVRRIGQINVSHILTVACVAV
jgi:solute carrier family 8 (sodium/calcium exchanger)